MKNESEKKMKSITNALIIAKLSSAESRYRKKLIRAYSNFSTLFLISKDYIKKTKCKNIFFSNNCNII